ncbi:MAG: hypothetical protein IJX06_00380 [Clostridia bacterium]|nr:hypothetical protein [Clostridia bacterium]
MKKLFTLFAILMMSLVFALTACQPETPNTITPQGPQSAPFAPWDELDGGRSANEITAQSFNDSDYFETTVANPDESLKAVTGVNPVNIDLSTLSASTAPDGTEFTNGVLTITAGGTYVLSGTLNGASSTGIKVKKTLNVFNTNINVNATKTVSLQTNALPFLMRTLSSTRLTTALRRPRKVTFSQTLWRTLRTKRRGTYTSKTLHSTLLPRITDLAQTLYCA